VANISWTYKTTDDVVKVEVWDVVDIGTRKAPATTLKLGETAEEPGPDPLPVLDATFVDVFKGAQGVIFMFDITKLWTFEYVQREIEKVPKELPVLILGNFRDRGEHRAVLTDSVTYWVESLDRFTDEEAGNILYAESSLAKGFGLMYAYRFFNLPYLLLQRQQLIKRLEINKDEITASRQELEITGINTREQDYAQFCEHLKSKRGKKMSAAEAEQAAYTPPPQTNASGGIGPARSGSESGAESNVSSQPGSRVTSPVPSDGAHSPGASPSEAPAKKKSSGFFSRGEKKEKPSVVGKVKGAPAWWGKDGAPGGAGGGAGANVDDFVPEGDVDGFLGSPPGSPGVQPPGSPPPLKEESSDDDDGAPSGLLMVVDDSDVEFSDQGGDDEDEAPPLKKSPKKVAAPAATAAADADAEPAEAANPMLADPDSDVEPELAATNGGNDGDSDAGSGANAADDSSEDELPDGWIDTAKSEAIAKANEAKRLVKMKQLREMQKKQAEERETERQFAASPSQLAAAEAGEAGNEYDDLDGPSSPAPPALSNTHPATSPTRPAADVATFETPSPKKRGGLSFAAYAPPSPAVIVPVAPKVEKSKIPDNETEEEKKKREKKERKEKKKKEKEAKEGGGAAEEVGPPAPEVPLEEQVVQDDSSMYDSWLGPEDGGGSPAKKKKEKKEKKAKAAAADSDDEDATEGKKKDKKKKKKEKSEESEEERKARKKKEKKEKKAKAAEGGGGEEYDSI
jgi:hypothetical protein